MTTLDELRRLYAAATQPSSVWHASENPYPNDPQPASGPRYAWRVGAVSRSAMVPILAQYLTKEDAALTAAARNALPALLRVAEAARNATSLNSLCAELMVKLHGADPTIEDESALNSLYEEEEAAWVELHAALAALETQS